MKQIEKLLLRQLIDHQGEYVTSRSLASELSLSDRTIRNYMKVIKDEVEEHGGKLSAKQGQGYQLEIFDHLEFSRFLKQREVTFRSDLQVTEFFESEDRQKYLLNKLLLEDEAIFIEDLEDELFISRSSLVNDIHEIKKKLLPYALRINSKPHQGMWIEGHEQDKRHFIMDIFFGNHYTNSLKEYLGTSHFFKEINIEELVIIILDEIREVNLKVSDFIIQNLTLHLALAIKRVREGFHIEGIPLTKDIASRLEFQVSKNIMERIERVMQVVFPEEEVFYLALHLMAKSNREEKVTDQELLAELTVTLNQFAQFFHRPLNEDHQLKNGLLNHLAPMLVRLEQGITLENPLKEEIMKEDRQAFEQTKQLFSQMPLLRNYEINDDEWAYLTLHIMAALEKIKSTHKIHALIICATGYGSAQLLKNRVLSEFGETIVVTNVKGYYEINEAVLKEADMIISSIDLSTIFFKIPVLHVSVFLNSQDIQKIRETIAECLPCQSIKKESISLPAEKKQHYYQQLLSEKWFTVYAQQPTKEEVIQELLQLLGQEEANEYLFEMTEQIKRREKMGQIIFSENIVVPHPAIPIGATTKIAVALIPGGMTWDEHEGIQFVFLVSPSFIENEGITVVTKAIVRFIDRTDLQHHILETPTFHNFNDQFSQMVE